jgi:hypothetical protein
VRPQGTRSDIGAFEYIPLGAAAHHVLPRRY